MEVSAVQGVWLAHASAGVSAGEDWPEAHTGSDCPATVEGTGHERVHKGAHATHCKRCHVSRRLIQAAIHRDSSARPHTSSPILITQVLTCQLQHLALVTLVLKKDREAQALNDPFCHDPHWCDPAHFCRWGTCMINAYEFLKRICAVPEDPD